MAFDRIVGFERLKAFHLNDSLREFGSRVDRHTHIGKGKLGLDAFSLLVNDERFLDRPMILETPKGPDDRLDRRNLAVLRRLRGSPDSPRQLRGQPHGQRRPAVSDRAQRTPSPRRPAERRR